MHCIGIRDQGSGIGDRGSGIRDQGAGHCRKRSDLETKLRQLLILHIASCADFGGKTCGAIPAPFLMMIQSYEDLEVWRLSMRLAKEVEDIASRLPVREQYGLAQQLRRASSSIPSNIAEGSIPDP